MTGFRVDPGSDGTVRLSGELDMAVADGSIESVLFCLDRQPELVLDVSELTFVDSTGIRALLRLAGMVQPRPLILRSPQPNVARIFEIVNLEGLGIRVEPS